MTTNAHNSKDDEEKHPADTTSDAGIEFATISPFDQFATLSNNPGDPNKHDQTTSETEGSETSATQRSDDNSIIAGGSSYQLIAEVARSPRAVIYKARQLASNRLVILKLFLAAGLPRLNAERFLSEIAAASKLSHPGIVSVYDNGSYDGQPFICMEHIDGRSLSDQIKDGPLPPKQAAEIVQQIAEALSNAHQNGVVHGHLTPSNVLCDVRMVPHLVGFGQSSWQLTSESFAKTPGSHGDAGFLSPEQARDPNASDGPSVDIYGAGAILYYLLTARPPFLSSNPEETLRQIVEDDAASPRLLNRQVPIELEAICQKCLSKTPARRYATTAEIAADLERWLKGEPVQAVQAATTEQRPPRMKPRLLSILRNASLMLLAAFGLSLFFKSIQDRATHRDLMLSMERTKQAERELEAITRSQAESHEEAKRSLKMAQDALLDATQARKDAEQASQLAEKAMTDLQETKDLIGKARTDLEFLETSKLVAKLEARLETVRQLGLKGEFDEALRQLDELIDVNVGQLPPSMREEKTKIVESLREEVIQLKNKPEL